MWPLTCGQTMVAMLLCDECGEVVPEDTGIHLIELGIGGHVACMRKALQLHEQWAGTAINALTRESM